MRSVVMTGPSSEADVVGLIRNRACRNCVRIKVRCIPLSGHEDRICQRCHRLGKTCMTPPISTRTRQKKRLSKIAQIEEKINQLSDLFGPRKEAAEAQRTVSTGANQPSPTSVPCLRSENGFPRTALPSPSLTTDHTSGETPLARPLSEKVDTGGHDPIVQAGDTPQQHSEQEPQMLLSQHNLTAQLHMQVTLPDFCPIIMEPGLEGKLFTEFVQKMLPLFPLVSVDENSSVKEIKKCRPFMYWAAITTVSYRDKAVHKRLNQEMLRGFGEYMLVRGFKSLDLLQGILLVLGWYHFYAHANPQFMNLVNLAQSLVTDLGFNRPTESPSKLRMMSDATRLVHGSRVITGLETDEDRRAFVSFYILSSKVASSFSRSEPMPFTRHLQDCCQALQNKSKHSSDLRLLALARLHHIAGKYANSDPTIANAPVRPLAAMFEDELARFLAEQPAALQEDKLIRMEVQSARICIYEPSQFHECDSTVDRIATLHDCLEATEDFFGILSDLPVEDCPYIPITFWLSLIHGLLVLVRLSFLELPGWDLQYVRKKFNFATACTGMARKFEDAYKMEQSQLPEFFACRYNAYAEKMRKCRQWFETKIQMDGQAHIMGSDRSNHPTTTDSDPFFGSLIEGFDGNFWETIMGDLTTFEQMS